jgi:hypothetical protein
MACLIVSRQYALAESGQLQAATASTYTWNSTQAVPLQGTGSLTPTLSGC